MSSQTPDLISWEIAGNEVAESRVPLPSSKYGNRGMAGWGGWGWRLSQRYHLALSPSHSEIMICRPMGKGGGGALSAEVMYVLLTKLSQV